MANKCYIKEFTSLPNIRGDNVQIWTEPGDVEQQFTVSGTAANSNPFNAATRYIAFTSDLDISYLVSKAGTSAATTNFPLWSKNILVVKVNPGDTLSAIVWS